MRLYPLLGLFILSLACATSTSGGDTAPAGRAGTTTLDFEAALSTASQACSTRASSMITKITTSITGRISANSTSPWARGRVIVNLVRKM